MDLRVRIRSRRSSEKKEQSNFPSSTTSAGITTAHRRGGGGSEEEEEEEEEDEAGEMDVEQPLSPAARLFVQRNFDCYVIAIIGLGRPIDVDASISNLELTLGKHPRFCSIMDEFGSGPPRWVRTKLCVADHIVIPPLEEGKELPPGFVEAYVGKLTGTPLDKSKPLWEMHFLNGKTKDAEATAVLKVHHSLGDGISLMSLLLACTRKVSDPESLPTIPRAKRRGSDGKACQSFLTRLWLFLRLMWYSLIDCLLLLATALFFKDTNNPIKGSKDMQSRPNFIVHSTLSLDDIKLVKIATSATVNDVMLGLATAGVVRYMNRRYAKMNGVDDEKPSIPSNSRVRTTVLFNTRQTPGLHELAEMMKGNTDVKWGNKLGYMVIPIPMKMHKDPLGYVRQAKATADRKKMSLEAYFSYYGGLLIAKIFGFKVATAMCHSILSNTTFSFSSVIGPMEEVEFFGNPIVYIAPTVYGHPHALTIHFQSYANKVKLVISVDEQSVPDPGQLCTDIEESLAMMKNSLNKKIGDKIEILSTQK